MPVSLGSTTNMQYENLKLAHWQGSRVRPLRHGSGYVVPKTQVWISKAIIGPNDTISGETHELGGFLM